MNKRILTLLIFCISILISTYEYYGVQQIPVIKLEEYKRIDKSARDEVSGIVKSLRYEDTFWIHGDSGTKDNIYAINENGEIKSDDKNYIGTELKGAKNKDWEDISRGEAGELIVADIGNNCTCRNDLKLFVINEPEPDAEEVEVIREYDIVYPPANTISSLFFKESPNAEAIFMRNGKIHLISKEGRTGRIFSLDNPKEGEINKFSEIDTFKFRGLVTAADISPDEQQIAVLTKYWLWLFEPGDEEKLSDGVVKAVRLSGATQIESIAFSGENLVIAEENGKLYRVPLSEFVNYED